MPRTCQLSGTENVPNRLWAEVITLANNWEKQTLERSWVAAVLGWAIIALVSSWEEGVSEQGIERKRGWKLFSKSWEWKW